MPYSVNLDRYTFLLNQKTQLILDAFKSSCEKYFRKESKENKLSADLEIGDSRLREGFFPKIIRTWENVTERKYGGNFVTLNPLANLQLDPKADKILYDYTNEINTLFSKNNFSSLDLNEQNQIYSPALIFRILLLRLITIALCNDNTYVRDGEVLLDIYTDFIDKVLLSADKFGHENEIFKYFSTKDHLEWMHAIRQVVSAVKLIHSHQDNVTECLTNLRSITYSIQRMLLAHLAIANKKCNWGVFGNMKPEPKITATDLEDQFIEDTLTQYEEFLTTKNTIKDTKELALITKNIGIVPYAAIETLGRKQRARSILDVKDISENSQLAALIACKNNDCPDEIYEKLEELYAAYFKSRCLLISLEQLDELLTTCSWVPLVTGMINLAPICNLIRIHSEKCVDLLAIPNDGSLNRLTYHQAIMQKCFHAQSLLKELNKRVVALEELQNPIKIEKVKYHITHNINNLLKIQSALEICLFQCNPKPELDDPNTVTTPLPLPIAPYSNAPNSGFFYNRQRVTRPNENPPLLTYQKRM